MRGVGAFEADRRVVENESGVRREGGLWLSWLGRSEVVLSAETGDFRRGVLGGVLVCQLSPRYHTRGR